MNSKYFKLEYVIYSLLAVCFVVYTLSYKENLKIIKTTGVVESVEVIVKDSIAFPDTVCYSVKGFNASFKLDTSKFSKNSKFEAVYQNHNSGSKCLLQLLIDGKIVLSVMDDERRINSKNCLDLNIIPLIHSRYSTYPDQCI